MLIKKVQAYRTGDGVYHSTETMAQHHIANACLVEELSPLFPETDRNGAQDILNALSGRRKLVREWLDACDAMEAESLR